MRCSMPRASATAGSEANTTGFCLAPFSCISRFACTFRRSRACFCEQVCRRRRPNVLGNKLWEEKPLKRSRKASAASRGHVEAGSFFPRGVPMSVGRLEVLRSAERPLDPDDALAEAEHRFANSLTIVAALIRTQARNLPQVDVMTTADVKTLLAGIGARIAAVGRLHRLLIGHGACTTVELSAYLAEIATVACEAFTDGRMAAMQTDLRAKPLIPIKDAGAIGLIVSEGL